MRPSISVTLILGILAIAAGALAFVSPPSGDWPVWLFLTMPFLGTVAVATYLLESPPRRLTDTVGLMLGILSIGLAVCLVLMLRAALKSWF